MKKVLVSLLACVIVMAVIGSPATLTAAAATPQPALPSNLVKPIYINKQVYVNVVDVSLAPSNDGKTVSYTLSFYNGSNKSINLLDYWFRLGSNRGESFPLKLSSADSKKRSIAPRTTTYLHLNADVGGSTRLADLILKVVRFDFTLSSYETGVGRFTFPSSFTGEVKPGSYKKLYVGNTVINAKILQSFMNSSDESHQLEITMSYNNVGKQTVKLPKYKYVLVTSEGYMYNAIPSETADIELSPWNKKELLVTVDVPAVVKNTGWKMVVLEDGGEEGRSTPSGVYQVTTSASDNKTAADNFNYSNSQGKYKFQLESLTRQPWEDGDVLSATVRIENQGTDSLSIPNMEGYFYLDNKVKIDFKRVMSASTVGIQPGSAARFSVYAKMASNYQFTTAKVVLNEKKEQSSVKAGELQSSAFLAKLPVLAETAQLDINREGSKSRASINRVAVYEGVTTKTYTVQVAMGNMERRTISPVKLTGYFINENNEVFPAKPVIAEGKMTPNSKSIVRFESTLPKQVSTANFRLILGESVSDQAFTDGNANADGYVNAVSYSLPSDIPVRQEMANLEILPYKFTISKMTPLFTNDGIVVRLHYKLDKDMTISVFPEDVKLKAAIEYYDPVNQEWVTKFQQELEIEKTSTTSLRVGERDLELKQPTEDDSVNLGASYRFRVYEVLGTNQKMIAEKQFNWYIENKW